MVDLIIMNEQQQTPIISVVVEGYNETRHLGEADGTMAALASQEFPVGKMEVILVGTEAQAGHWREAYAESPFHSVKAIAKSQVHYFELKNAGAQIASGSIIAFTDSDVQPRPTWVPAIVDGIEAGADVTVGPSLFHKDSGLMKAFDSPLMRATASVTWGWVLGRRRDGGIPQARGFMDHNMAMRASLFRDHQHRTEFGRILSSSFVFRGLVESGCRIEVQARQQAVHHFSWRYWLISLHLRYGHEVYRLRRLNSKYPNQWIRKTWILEPIVTLIWHMALDVPRWFRLMSLLQTSWIYRWGWFPLLIGVSAISRTSEAAGLALTMIAPKRMQRWAERV